MIISVLLIIFTGTSFFAGLMQGWAAYLDMKDHYGQKKQQRNFYKIIFFYVVLTAVFIIATVRANYIAPSEKPVIQTNNQPAQTSSSSPSHNNLKAAITPTSTPAPTSTPVQAGITICHEDWHNGMDGWEGSSDWKILDGMLINDGTNTSNNNDTILAPCQLPTGDYAIESTIKYVRGGYGFGILARGGGNNGYEGWISVDSPIGQQAEIVYTSQTPFDYLTQKSYPVDDAWHTYRFEVKGLNLGFFIDGSKVAETTDATYLSAGRVGLTVNGLWSGCQIYVKSFQVTAL